MKLHFLGANRQVTGSRYCLEVGDDRVMIDCGMFQERPYLDRNWDECPLAASEFKALVLTHAHVDHCGLIPKFVREGFGGPILCTRPTVELTEVIFATRRGFRVKTSNTRRDATRKKVVKANIRKSLCSRRKTLKRRSPSCRAFPMGRNSPSPMRSTLPFTTRATF